MFATQSKSYKRSSKRASEILNESENGTSGVRDRYVEFFEYGTNYLEGLCSV